MILNYLIKIFKTNIFISVLTVFFLGIFILSRTFMGIDIFGYRIGELSILFSFVFLIFSILQFKNNNLKVVPDSVKILIASAIATFILFVIISEGDFLNLYVYKSSSYIWTLGFLFFGSVIGSFINIKKEMFYLFFIILIYLYVYSIYGIPESYQNNFLNYADKFEYHKGSDVLIMFTSVFFLYNRSGIFNKFNSDIFLIFSSIYAPLLLYKSRGAFISFLLFVLFELLFLKNNFKRSALKNLLILLIVIVTMLQSLFIVNKNGVVEVDEINQNVQFIVDYRKVAPSPKEVSRDFLYFYDNRLYSGDGNLNWRLQIWQDVIEDLNEQGMLLIGFGFNEKFEAMDDPFRSGNDGTNENVHNYLINILGRGGLIHLLIFILIFYFLIKKCLSKNNIFILNFIIPTFIASNFDASMENSHFPLIFYFIFGIMLNTKNNRLIN